MVVQGELEMGKYSKTSLIEFLKHSNFKIVDDSYNYLIQIPIYDFTTDSIDELVKNIEKLHTSYDILYSTSCEKLWFNELDELQSKL